MVNFGKFFPKGRCKYGHLYHGPPKPKFLEVFIVNNLVFRWPKLLFFMVLGAHGSHLLVDASGVSCHLPLRSLQMFRKKNDKKNKPFHINDPHLGVSENSGTPISSIKK